MSFLGDRPPGSREGRSWPAGHRGNGLGALRKHARNAAGGRPGWATKRLCFWRCPGRVDRMAGGSTPWGAPPLHRPQQRVRSHLCPRTPPAAPCSPLNPAWDLPPHLTPLQPQDGVLPGHLLPAFLQGVGMGLSPGGCPPGRSFGPLPGIWKFPCSLLGPCPRKEGGLGGGGAHRKEGSTARQPAEPLCLGFLSPQLL